MIFLINPDEERLIIVMVNSSTLRPISVESSCLQESIAFFKEEVVGDQLVLLRLGHGAKRIESSSELSLECAASLNNFQLNLISLLTRDS